MTENTEKRILFVDDDSFIVLLITTVFEILGHEVISASDYESARAIWAERQGGFDLAVLDYVLGDRSGLELAQCFWSEKPGLPVLVTSGFVGDFRPSEESLRSHFEFLHKPFKMAELREKVTSLLGETSIVR
jgi:two-component system, cell cycle response regulator CpdR